MSELVWFYPEALEEIPALLARDGVIPHGGGTGILRSRRKNLHGLIDLSRLPLSNFSRENGCYHLGAALTFAEAAIRISRTDPHHALVQALSSAASTPLRNRISLGGSIALYPLWSDLMGPLIGLEAEVTLYGAGRYPITEFLSRPDLRRGRLITTVHVADLRWEALYHRENRTKNDYPAFTATILARRNGRSLAETRIVLSGLKGKYRRQGRLESLLLAREAAEPPSEAEIDESLDAEFGAKRLGDADYLRRLAVVALHRGLSRLLQWDDPKKNPL